VNDYFIFSAVSYRWWLPRLVAFNLSIFL